MYQRAAAAATPPYMYDLVKAPVATPIITACVGWLSILFTLPCDFYIIGRIALL